MIDNTSRICTIGGSEIGGILKNKEGRFVTLKCDCGAFSCDGERHYDFSSAYDTYLEKIGVKEKEFKGNSYTNFGNKLEPIILKKVNEILGTNYKEYNNLVHPKNKAIVCNLDGYDKSADCPLLEIKTGGFVKDFSRIEAKVKNYYEQVNVYNRLLKLNNKKTGKMIIAVYFRPEIFHFTDDELEKIHFDEKNLYIFEVEQHEEFQDYGLEKMEKLTEYFDLYKNFGLVLEKEEFDSIFIDGKKPRKKMKLRGVYGLHNNFNPQK